MRNYELQPCDDQTASTLRRIFDQLIPGTNGPCILCGAHIAYHYAACFRCRDACSHVALNGYIVIANGDRQAKSHCLKCGANLGGLPRGSAILDFCIWDKTDPTPCERCGESKGVELHHWAPRNTFGWEDAETWPVANLCRDCHHEWHRRMDGYQWRRRSA